MIQPTKEEVWASNVLNNNVASSTAELQRAVAARDAHIRLLELKYDAVFNLQTGQLEPKPKEKGKDEAAHNP